MTENKYGKVLAGRCAVCYFMSCVLFIVCVLRLYSAATNKMIMAGNSSARYSVAVTRPRGMIYDASGIPLNNRNERIIAAASPSPQAISVLCDVLKGDPSLTGILERLNDGKPIICELPYIIECDGVVCIAAEQSNTPDKPAVHTVGYTDSSGHGVSGLEAAFDDLLYSDDCVEAVFELNGAGYVLGDKAPEIRGLEYRKNAVYTTLSAEIQKITEECCAGIKSGAAVVCEIGTGKLRAVVSKPDFDCTAVSEYLNDTDSPLINKALSAYSVGSVFKPCVAAAGIEGKCGTLTFNCSGSVELDGRAYHCHNRSGHGLLSLEGALTESCNTFFYQFASAVGASAIYEKAVACSFGCEFEIAPGLKSSAGALPELKTLYSSSSLANLSIGQGSLLLSPVAVLTLYCAIASDGGYYLPTIVEKQVRGGVSESITASKKTIVMEAETAERIRKYLSNALNSGTGTAAKPSLCSAGGKTATAQTGRFSDSGSEINMGWFCGFFPAEAPKYAVSIMIEDANGYDAAPIFAAIADGITELENGQPRNIGASLYANAGL